MASFLSLCLTTVIYTLSAVSFSPLHFAYFFSSIMELCVFNSLPFFLLFKISILSLPVSGQSPSPPPPPPPAVHRMLCRTINGKTVCQDYDSAMSPSRTSPPAMSSFPSPTQSPATSNFTPSPTPSLSLSFSPSPSLNLPRNRTCTSTTCNSTSPDKPKSNTNNTVNITSIHTKSKSKSKYLSPIVLSAATVASVLLIVAVLLVIDYRKRVYFFKQRHGNEDKNSKVEKFLHDYVHEMPKRSTYSQIKKISRKFSDKLGEGGFGVVYKGKLRKGDLVAVKMLDQSRQSETQFMNEVATIGRIHHFHLVRLLGYCFEGRSKRALIYEYMVNGSLEKFIFKGDQENEKILSWERLNSIALGTARGLAYLHEECNRRIIHFDIKPHNILLDEDFTPKVSDFGLAKLCGKGDDHISMTAWRGTVGYVAPELCLRDLGPVTDKSDIYSFGMMLLEMVGGRKNLDVQVSRPSQVYFPDWAFKLLQNGELETRLRGRGETEMGLEEKEVARKLTKVGLWCIQYNSTDRPSIGRVVQMLEGNAEDVADPPLPRNESPSPPWPTHVEESMSTEIEAEP